MPKFPSLKAAFFEIKSSCLGGAAAATAGVAAEVAAATSWSKSPSRPSQMESRSMITGLLRASATSETCSSVARQRRARGFSPPGGPRRGFRARVGRRALAERRVLEEPRRGLISARGRAIAHAARRRQASSSAPNDRTLRGGFQVASGQQLWGSRSQALSAFGLEAGRRWFRRGSSRRAAREKGAEALSRRRRIAAAR